MAYVTWWPALAPWVSLRHWSDLSDVHCLSHSDFRHGVFLTLTFFVQYWAAVSGAGWPGALQGVHTPVIVPALQQRHTPQTSEEAIAHTHGECVDVWPVFLLSSLIYLHVANLLNVTLRRRRSPLIWRILCRNLRRPSAKLCLSRLRVTKQTAKHTN